MTYVSDDNIHHSAIGEYWGPITGFVALRANARSGARGALADLGVGRVNAADALLVFTSESTLRAFFEELPNGHKAWRIKDGDAVLRAAHKAGIEIALDLQHDPVDPSGVLYTDVTSSPGNYNLSRRRIKVGALFNRAGALVGIVALHGVSHAAIRKLKAIAQRNGQALVVHDGIRSATGDHELRTSLLLSRPKLHPRSKA